jgi:hypothetical protein
LRVLLVLLDLADQSLPEEGTAARTIIRRCKKLIRYTSSARDWPEVVLGMTVVCGASLDEIAGDQLGQFTKDIRTVLRQLGCREIAFDCFPEPELRDLGIVAGRTA